MKVIASQVSIGEYLSNPAYEHCEYVDGQVIELHVGNKKHARIQIRCARKLDEYFDRRPDGGYVGAELHCRLTIGNETRFRLPDICVVIGQRFSADGYLEGGPDLAVEVRSPDDSIAAQMRKIEDYFANGTRLAWLILPEERTVLVLTPDGAPRTLVSGNNLTGGELLPGLEFPVDFLFG